jgi:hydrogenase maturation protease
MTPLLVIGYGNELRGDDGAGPRVARIVAGWSRPDVRAVAVHQLTPELAPLIADAERVIFVDAVVDGEYGWRRLIPSELIAGLGHTSDPAWLLALTAEVFGRNPEAWLVTIPARRLEVGTGLSPEVVRKISQLLRRLSHNSKTPSTVVASSAG